MDSLSDYVNATPAQRLNEERKRGWDGPEALRFYEQEMRAQERDATADLLPTVHDSLARLQRDSMKRNTRKATK